MNTSYSWEAQFRDLHTQTAAKIRSGERNLANLFTEEDRNFLQSIGSKPIEMFDAADDFVNDGEPSLEDILIIHRIRYDYFLNIQNKKFPPLITQYRGKNTELGGIRWLPRAIDKVRAKVSGRLIDDLFYPCGGDRQFLRSIGMSAPQFFELVVNTPSEEEILNKIKQAH